MYRPKALVRIDFITESERQSNDLIWFTSFTDTYEKSSRARMLFKMECVRQDKPIGLVKVFCNQELFFPNAKVGADGRLTRAGIGGVLSQDAFEYCKLLMTAQDASRITSVRIWESCSDVIAREYFAE